MNRSTSVGETSAVVRLQQLRKTYGAFAAVQDITLDVARGEFLCLLGPSGCGKTTTLRMVAGFIRPTSGTIMIDGVDVTHSAPRYRDTGMVFQSYALFPHMTVEQNISFGLENIGLARAKRGEQIAEMLELVELTHLAKRYPRQLSGGQQQRVALARALAIRPAVLLLDEPFSNLDAQLRVRMREDLHRLIKKINVTTLFVTHDQEEALTLSDRIVVMKEGTLQQIGTPEEVYHKPATRFVAEFIGQCTILEGNITGDGYFHTPTGFRYPMSAPAGPATVVLRPENVKQADGRGIGEHYQAVVVSTSFGGATCRVTLDVEGQRIVMDESFGEGAIPANGATIPIMIGPDALRLVNAR